MMNGLLYELDASIGSGSLLSMGKQPLLIGKGICGLGMNVWITLQFLGFWNIRGLWCVLLSIRLWGPRTLPSNTHEHAPFPQTANLLARLNSEETEQGSETEFKMAAPGVTCKYELFVFGPLWWFKWQFQLLVLLQYLTASVSLPMAYTYFGAPGTLPWQQLSRWLHIRGPSRFAENTKTHH